MPEIFYISVRDSCSRICFQSPIIPGNEFNKSRTATISKSVFLLSNVMSNTAHNSLNQCKYVVIVVKFGYAGIPDVREDKGEHF